MLRGPVEPKQYVSLAFGRAAGQAGIAVSMGSRGDAYDNAVAETFFATLKRQQESVVLVAIVLTFKKAGETQLV